MKRACSKECAALLIDKDKIIHSFFSLSASEKRCNCSLQKLFCFFTFPFPFSFSVFSTEFLAKFFYFIWRKIQKSPGPVIQRSHRQQQTRPGGYSRFSLVDGREIEVQRYLGAISKINATVFGLASLRSTGESLTSRSPVSGQIDEIADEETGFVATEIPSRTDV